MKTRKTFNHDHPSWNVRRNLKGTAHLFIYLFCISSCDCLKCFHLYLNFVCFFLFTYFEWWLDIQLLEEDHALKRFKSYKHNLKRVSKIGDILTIVVVAGICFFPRETHTYSFRHLGFLILCNTVSLVWNFDTIKDDILWGLVIPSSLAYCLVSCFSLLPPNEESLLPQIQIVYCKVTFAKFLYQAIDS